MNMDPKHDETIDRINREPMPDQLAADVIHTYTRADALRDGVLVDLSEWAREVGFVVPVAVSTSVWADIESIPPEHNHQDARGRAHDLLWMAAHACKGGIGHVTAIMPVENGVRWHRDITRPENRQSYRIHSGPGDQGEHVITITQLDED